MDTSRERDQSIERLLRQSLQTPRPDGVTDSCLDAETLAAWIDGGLSGAALEMAQTHVADCARCQSMVGAMARTNAVVAQPAPERALRRWLPWLVPLTAAAAAVGLWVAVPGDLSDPVVPQRPAEVRTQTAETNTQQPASLDNQPQASTARTETQAAPSADKKAETQVIAPEFGKEIARLEADGLRRQDAAAAPAAAAPSAPVAAETSAPTAAARPAAVAEEASAPAAAAPPAAPAAEGARLARSANGLVGTITAANQIVSPNPSIRWRIAGSVVEHSADGGSSWAAVPTGVAAELTAGAAPSTLVCWLVGRGGMVLLTTDGRTWRRVAFPEMTDLSAVRATDARTASVSTADGRIFTTSNGGVTWDRR